MIEEDEKKLMHVNIGTIGHVDHGKTTLTADIIKVLVQKRSMLEDFSYISKNKGESITINADTIEGGRTLSSNELGIKNKILVKNNLINNR